jgi:hypothetical protein
MAKKDDASKRLAKTPRGENSGDAVTAIGLLQSKWAPPKTPAFSALEQRHRLPLTSVLNFLAFNAPDAPSDMPSVMCAAHRGRAFKALYAAAREGEVTLFGTPPCRNRRTLSESSHHCEVFSDKAPAATAPEANNKIH